MICECLRLRLLCFSSWRAPGPEEDFHTAACLTSERCEMYCQLLSLGEMATSAKYTCFGTATPDCHIVPFVARESQNHLGWKTPLRSLSPNVLSQFEVMITPEVSDHVVFSYFLAQLSSLYICKSLVPLMSGPDIKAIHFLVFQLNKNVSR